MMMLIVGLIVFLGVHLLPTIPDVREGFRARAGEATYKGIFSLLSLAGLAVIVLGYQKMQLYPGKNPVLWDAPAWMHHVSALLMLPAMILIVAAYVPSRIRTAVKNPMLLAVKLWAVAHLLSNGDVASLLLFGSFFGYALYDLISVKKRTANVPGDTMAPASGANDLLVIGVGIALYAALLFGAHEWLIGVAPIPSLGYSAL